MSGESTEHHEKRTLQDSLKCAAWEIAEVLLADARIARDGSITWYYPGQPGPSIQPVLLGPHLFAGTPGIALFFASMSRVFGGEGFRDIALRAMAPLRADIRRIASDAARARRLQQPMGGLAGLGSIVYALVRIGDLLEDTSLTLDAHVASSLILPERIDSDENLDVMTGSAGALLALLALDERRQEEDMCGVRPIELASRCAHHLLHHDGWTMARGPAADGFCHGMAGICAALARLCERTGPSPVWTLLDQLLTSRRAVLEPFGRNQDAPRDAEMPNSWCKGPPGISLGCIAMLRVMAYPSLRDEAIAALKATGARALCETDDICCGNCGRIDVLVYAARALEDPLYFDMALDLASRLLERARRRGGYSLKLARDVGVDLRLFPGLAGIGYSFARLLAADVVPCVLAME